MQDIKYVSLLCVTDLRPIQSGVPQGSILGPITHFPTVRLTTTATFAADISILPSNMISKNPLNTYYPASHYSKIGVTGGVKNQLEGVHPYHLNHVSSSQD